MNHHPVITQVRANAHRSYQPEPQKGLTPFPKTRLGWITSSFCILALSFGAAQAEETLLDEDFSRPAKGTFLEQAPEFDWQVEKGRLIIGNGRELNRQALGYAPNHTWSYQNYYRDLDATLAPGEAIEVSFSAAVKTDASPEFYIYAMRLNDGDDY
ncbi:MAG: hypothetical protein ACQKBU_11830, partial [Verrucomicrobiales bacterium]